MFFLTCFALPLGNLNFRGCWCVRRYEASVAAAVDNVFLCEIVLVEQSDADTCNAHKNSFWILSFNLWRWR